MAADQRKRRLNASPAFGYGSREQHRTKRKNLVSRQQYDLNLNSHISLKWDDNDRRVVAKEQQVAISWRHLTPFSASNFHRSNALADVLAIPKNVFELKDLTEVLSYEVWHSLTDKERNYLMQFLPRGVETEELMQALLAGDNFHFGNPFLRWSAALLSGELHPDAVVHNEKSFKDNKKAYYSELQEYHDNMIGTLQKMKERCANSKDPEMEISQIWRLKIHNGNHISPDPNGLKSHIPEVNPAAVSESNYWVRDEITSNNDNQTVMKSVELQKSQDTAKEKNDKPVGPSNGQKVVPRPKKGEKPQKVNGNCSDGAKYMSYVKISKQQYEVVKNMKQSGSSIQYRNLNRVLGNLDGYLVKPYEMFEEEEQKRIHEHWLNLATKHIPAEIAHWSKRRSEKFERMRYLWLEMEGKLHSRRKVEEATSPSDERKAETPDEEVSSAVDVETTDLPERLGDKEREDPWDEENHHEESAESQDEKVASPLDEERTSPHELANDHGEEQQDTQGEEADNSLCTLILQQADNKESDLLGKDSQSLMQHVSPQFNTPSPSQSHAFLHNCKGEFSAMDLNGVDNHFVCKTNNEISSISDYHVASKASEALPSISYAGHHCSTDARSTFEAAHSSGKDPWCAIGLPDSYGHPSSSNLEYATSKDPSLRSYRVPENQSMRLIDLESTVPEEDPTKDLLNRTTVDMSFFSSYPNRDRSELLHSLIRSDNYHQEPKKIGLEFESSTNMLMQTPQLPGHFQDPLTSSFPLDHRQKAQSELFIQPNIHDSVYTNNARYSIPALNMRDWNNARISGPVHPHLGASGGLLNPSWFTGESRPHTSWSSSEGNVNVFSTHNLGSVVNSGDQSLYSVLSQCSSLRSRVPYDGSRSTEPFIPPPVNNYGPDMAPSVPISSHPLPQTPSPLDYLSGHEATTALKTTNPIGWMGLSHQTSVLHDSSGKPFLKSWNQ